MQIHAPRLIHSQWLKSETFAEVLTDVENIHINPTGKGHKSQVDAFFYQSVLPQGPKRSPAVLDELTTSFQRMSMHRAVEKFLSARKPKKLRNPAALQPTTEKWRCSGWNACQIQFYSWSRVYWLIDNANFLNEGNNFFSAEYQQVSKTDFKTLSLLSPQSHFKGIAPNNRNNHTFILCKSRPPQNKLFILPQNWVKTQRRWTISVFVVTP